MIEITQHFAATSKPIASICHGAQILAAAEVLKGRKLSAYPACAPEVRPAGGEFVDLPFEGATTDGNLVSGPAWTAHVEWLRQFTRVLAA